MAGAPLYVKGGAWTSLEDAILKNGIQKYGVHQWDKIASLLPKKNGRQCRIRWDEFLNPKLKLGQFSKKEDCRLLRLVKELPNQWRSIGDAMGRTAQVCIERYNTLLDAESDMGLDSSLGFKVGEVNPKAEYQTALPVEEDKMDDAEREMLAEARARLANTQGKKAARRTRERLLEESKRVAQLQRRREIKETGGNISKGLKSKKKGDGIDYNKDVVLEQAVPEGVYDTSPEELRNEKNLTKFEYAVNKRGLNQDENFKFIPNKKSKKPDDGKGSVNIKKRDTTSLINEYKKPAFPWSYLKMLSSSQVDANKKKKSKEEKKIIKELKKKFADIPTPENAFDIVLSDEEDEHTSAGSEIDEIPPITTETPTYSDQESKEIEPTLDFRVEEMIQREMHAYSSSPHPETLVEPVISHAELSNAILMRLQRINSLQKSTADMVKPLIDANNQLAKDWTVHSSYLSFLEKNYYVLYKADENLPG